jgi:hypothetical protein
VLYPNPLHEGNAFVAFDVASDLLATVVLCDVEGRAINTVNANLLAGPNTVEIRTAGLAAGIYLVRVQAGDQTFTERLVIAK